MSGTGEDRHRGGRKGNNDQQGSLQRQNIGPRDFSTTPQQNRRGGAGRGQNQAKQTENTPNGPPLTTRNESKRSDPVAAAPQEEHIPVNDFNSQEVRAGLRNTSDVKPAVYKPAEKNASLARSGSPWASKANMTANGKDFFVELRKQVAALQQSGALGNPCGFFNLTFTDGSSDDTSVAVIEKADIPNAGNWPKNYKSPVAILHFHKTITSNNVQHKGIHPIEALDSHRQNLAVLTNHALEHLPNTNMKTSRSQSLILQSGLIVGLQKRKPDFVTVTRGPGNRSNLACGLDLAKGLSVAWQVPLLAVHHMQAHALTPRLVWAMKSDSLTAELKPDFPFLSLLVSGGHTMLLHSTALTQHTILASTMDTAIGQALDRIGRLVVPADQMAKVTDTAYAKHLTNYAFKDETEYTTFELAKQRRDELSKQPNKFGWAIQTPFADTRELAFSFSGIASRIQALFEARQAAVEGGISDEERVLFARTALGTSFEHLASRVIIAIDRIVKDYEYETKLPGNKQNLRTLVVSGGVAANGFLRHVLRKMLDSRGFTWIEIVSPPTELCTDNAAMIGWCGIEMYEEGWRSSLSVDPLRSWSMDTDSDGLDGIVGVPGWTRAWTRPTMGN